MPHDWNNEGKDIHLDREMKAAGISDLPDIVSAKDFAALPMPPPPELIRGVLHKGSKAIYGGPSKAFKTWTLIDMGLAVSTGGDWLGFSTTPGRVLYINFELQEFGIHRRLHAIATDRKIGYFEFDRGARSLDYPFTLMELHLDKDGNGEGKVSVGTKISVNEDKQIELENYGMQPVQLNKVRRVK